MSLTEGALGDLTAQKSRWDRRESKKKKKKFDHWILGWGLAPRRSWGRLLIRHVTRLFPGLHHLRVSAAAETGVAENQRKKKKNLRDLRDLRWKDWILRQEPGGLSFCLGGAGGLPGGKGAHVDESLAQSSVKKKKGGDLKRLKRETVMEAPCL